MKKILIINGNPEKDSFSTALSERYEMGAKKAGATCNTIHLSELKFDPILRHGYNTRTELEPDLMDVVYEIESSDHLVFIYPCWWSTFPALLKGFIDRVFLPGFTFDTKPDSYKYKKLLKGKTARLIVTMDAPTWYYRLINGSPGLKAMKKCTLEFCGVKPVKVTTFGLMKTSSTDQREKMLQKAEQLGHLLK
ncbi:NAD(P)H-dependent oxidoreductase [Parabacteroides sp. FAFU027]|uniref:NAD(P)H-dependent oxidoreductase n=1 Tax=Parabacteroides sp. FAFU027 TaxID=2922715 RepID=UPI001FAF60DC|nr:NAD(P)H-dependent oxidoreductase [Parabacteroides sp. FAFU027]